MSEKNYLYLSPLCIDKIENRLINGMILFKETDTTCLICLCTSESLDLALSRNNHLETRALLLVMSPDAGSASIVLVASSTNG